MVTRLSEGYPKDRSAEATGQRASEVTITKCRNGFMVQVSRAAEGRCVVNTIEELLEVIQVELED